MYKNSFDFWVGYLSVMFQFVVWIVFEVEGLGVNFQYYNFFVDQKVQQEWFVLLMWKFFVQFVFGGKVGELGEKIFGFLE